MTTDEYIQSLRAKVTEIESGKALFLASSTATKSMVLRVFTNGLNSQNENIGQYNSTDPLYIDPNTSPKKFPTVGKTGKSVFASTGEKHKTGWFESYKAFRGKIGRETSKVNLQLTGELKSDVENGLQRISNTEYVLKLKRQIDADKIAGQEKRFGLIFHFTKQEREQFQNVFKFEATQK